MGKKVEVKPLTEESELMQTVTIEEMDDKAWNEEWKKGLFEFSIHEFWLYF